MAGFRKAKAEQAALKMGIYGAAGRGKTLTALLVAEGLGQLAGKRVAYVDTERGTDFYCKPVPERKVHPEAFDFDALYTRSLTDTLAAVRSLDPRQHAVVVLDSVTHLWEAARNAYNGKTTKVGTIPMHAWGAIKKPYKELMAYLLASPMHVLICGRQGNEYETDEDTDELKCVGTKMKAEGETPYEPHVLLHLFTERDKQGNTVHVAFAEKDRSGILSGRRIQLWPNQKTAYQLLAEPLLPLLGHTQARMETEDEASTKDAEALDEAERNKVRESEGLLAEWRAKITLCKTADALKALGKQITTDLKKRMTTSDVTELRSAYVEAEKRLSGERTFEPAEA